MTFRRLILALLGVISSGARAQTLSVTLLGTGSPEPAMERFGPGTLIEANGQRFLFDAGRGISQRLWQMNVPLGGLTNVFLTHLHSDHTVGLPDIWLTGWQQTAFGRRPSPLRVWGPPGTADFVSSLRTSYAVDVRVRTANGIPDSAAAIEGRDIVEGVLYDQGGVRVTGFSVDHGSPPIPSFGYRVDFGGRSVVISGDTRPSDNLVRFARGVDVLVHEVMAAFPQAAATPAISRILSSHTSPEEAGRIFADAKPTLAVYTHVGLMALPERRPALMETLLPRTRSTYTGRVVIGEDLMTFVVGDTIEIRRRESARR